MNWRMRYFNTECRHSRFGYRALMEYLRRRRSPHGGQLSPDREADPFWGPGPRVTKLPRLYSCSLDGRPEGRAER